MAKKASCLKKSYKFDFKNLFSKILMKIYLKIFEKSVESHEFDLQTLGFRTKAYKVPGVSFSLTFEHNVWHVPTKCYFYST